MNFKMLIEDADGHCLTPLELNAEQLALLAGGAKGFSEIVREACEMASIAEQGAEDAGFSLQ